MPASAALISVTDSISGSSIEFASAAMMRTEAGEGGTIGGGTTGGAVFGASDRIGAYPAADPVTPADLAATIFWRFGIDPRQEVRDQTGRPFRLSEGEPLCGLFA